MFITGLNKIKEFVFVNFTVFLTNLYYLNIFRFMLVSSKFCAKNIRLVFTIFDKTEFPKVKDNVLVHIADLLTRFPNIIEPWTPRIFQR